jgi:UDP-N-acetylmuramoylalanine--D-glutamate ligase
MTIDLDSRLTVIVGLGATGLSCVKYFAQAGEKVKVVDSRDEPPGLAALKELYPDVEYELGDFNLQTFIAAKQLVVSPGLSIRCAEIEAAKKAGVAITGDIDIFSKQVAAPIIAVTGSNGKSTVVAMLAEILRKAGKNFGLGGNLDGDNFKPALDLIAEGEKDLYLLELSSFQLETTESLGAWVATILNFSADHMDRYEGIDDYHRAKLRIFIDCKQVVINRDVKESYPLEKNGAAVWDFGFGRAGVNGLGLLEEGEDQYIAYQLEKIVSVNELKVFGRHNISNVLAAVALAMAIDIDMNAIKAAITEFCGLPHRCQWVANIEGVDFYNDSKGTNVGATVAAVEGLGEHISGHIVLIAGGIAKGANFAALVPAMNKWGKVLILIGQDAAEMASYFDKETQTYFASDMQDAARVALQHSTAGDAVLLSPACASFDMFENFQHRGFAFMKSVETLQ